MGSLVDSKEEIIEENSKKILKYLEENNGVMTITDKTEPTVIYQVFKISKKAFKDALGALYKQNLIEFHDDKVILS